MLIERSPTVPQDHHMMASVPHKAATASTAAPQNDKWELRKFMQQFQLRLIKLTPDQAEHKLRPWFFQKNGERCSICN